MMHAALVVAILFNAQLISVSAAMMMNIGTVAAFHLFCY